MNADFVEKMLQAKRLEAQAMALLVPPEARLAAAAAVRVCSAAPLEVLDGTHAPSRGASPGACEGSAAVSAKRSSRSGMQSIPIE